MASLGQLLLAFLGSQVIRIITASLRYQTVGGENLEQARRSEKPLIYLFWHGEQLLLQGWNPERHLCALTSLSRDGRLQARILENLGIKTVGGSSSRGGVAGLRGLLRVLRQGTSLAMAADGPRGPRHQLKSGALWLASRSASPLVPLRATSQKSHIFYKAWDRFVLPFPLSSVRVAVGEPVWLPPNLQQEEFLPWIAKLEQQLDLLAQRMGVNHTLR